MNNIDDNKVYKKGYMFEISVPETTRESDLYSLILRLNDLRCFVERNSFENWEVFENNRNIEEMQALLENFKIKKVDFNE